MGLEEPYARSALGIHLPARPIQHADEAYDADRSDLLRAMQSRHFWYRGRHRFILHALMRSLRTLGGEARADLRAIDLGGGAGGWIHYLERHGPRVFTELALSDASLSALTLAADVVGPRVTRYHADLMRLDWHERWDVAFLLDVLEHVPDDREALRQVRESLRPGGLLLVTTPALQSFWTYNDDLAGHLRRYSRRDFATLAQESGLELCDARYFMFFLSPLLLVSRWTASDVRRRSEREIAEHVRKTHRVPPRPINALLEMVFAAETPIGAWLPFPWGTSVLAVLRRPG